MLVSCCPRIDPLSFSTQATTKKTKLLNYGYLPVYLVEFNSRGPCTETLLLSSCNCISLIPAPSVQFYLARHSHVRIFQMVGILIIPYDMSRPVLGP
jgi:hypothetical protein